MDAMSPHSCWHGVFGSEPAKRESGGRMLRGQKEVVVLVEEGAVQCDQSLPLVVAQLRSRLWLGTLGCVDFDALGLDHEQAGIDALDFCNELLLADGTCIWLRYHARYRGGIFVFSGLSSTRPIRIASSRRPAAILCISLVRLRLLAGGSGARKRGLPLGP